MPIFDIVVIDTNFFIALDSAGIGSLLPRLQHYLDEMGGVKAITSSHIPKTDVPAKFRTLRERIPKAIQLVDVDRKNPVWHDIATRAKRERMIAYERDPADIDICFLALKYLRDYEKKVAVVSDDVGVARVINENPEFIGSEHLSNGAFLSILSTAMPPDKKAKLDRGIKIVFLQSWKYRNKSRNYIDINLLVDDLTDTAKFVRLAAEMAQNEVKAASSGTIREIETDTAKKEKPLSMDIKTIFDKFNKLREYRNMNNIIAVERELMRLPRMTSIAITEAATSEEKLILSQMIYAELFEIHSWSLNYRISKNSLIEALLHAEALLNVCSFVQTSDEIIENIISLKGLISLLLGKFATAYDLFTQIPVDDQMSPTQFLGLIVSYVAFDQYDKAKKLVKDNIDGFEGLSSSLYKYANDCYLRGQQELALKIMEFIFSNYYTTKKRREMLSQYPQRLFILSRIAPKMLKKETIELLTEVLGEKAIDNSMESIPKSLLSNKIKGKSLAMLENNELFQGTFYVLDIAEKLQEKNLEVLTWQDDTASLWKIIFDIEMKPAIEEAVSFKLKQGDITKISKRTSKDKENIRGSVKIVNPVLQVNIRIPWA